MIRHPRTFFYASLAVAGALMAPATAQTGAEAKPAGGQLTCTDFLALEDGEKNAVAAVVEQDLNAQLGQPTPDDLAVLAAAGIDPAAAAPPAMPEPGETMRVMAEACAENADGTVMDALTARAEAAVLPN
ncbi:hypothetical protein [Loktanella salsilacus]|uniref:hypothetical protein n=1 Tax=Loktanella salsilacus TaxID=195913 RepID=UPI0037361501